MLKALFSRPPAYSSIGTTTRQSTRYWFFGRPSVRLSAYSMYIPGAGRLSVPACSLPFRHLFVGTIAFVGAGVLVVRFGKAFPTEKDMNVKRVPDC
jgi:hypothetical protein